MLIPLRAPVIVASLFTGFLVAVGSRGAGIPHGAVFIRPSR
jgi:hypothetical protein